MNPVTLEPIVDVLQHLWCICIDIVVFFFCRFWDVFGFGIGEIKQNIAPFLEKGTKLLAVHDSCFGWGARGGVLLFFEVCWLGVCRRIYQNITSLDATSHELVFPRFSFK